MTTFSCFILRFDEKTSGYTRPQEKGIVFYTADEINLPHINEFLEAQTKDTVEVFSDKINKWIKVKELEELGEARIQEHFTDLADHFVNGCYIRVLKDSQRKIMKKNKQFTTDPRSITFIKEDTKSKSRKELSIAVKSRSNSASDKSTLRSRASSATAEVSRRSKEKQELRTVIVIPGFSEEKQEDHEADHTEHKNNRRKPVIRIQPCEELSEHEKEARTELLKDKQSVHEEGTKTAKKGKKNSLTNTEVPMNECKDNEKESQATTESDSQNIDALDAELAEWKEEYQMEERQSYWHNEQTNKSSWKHSVQTSSPITEEEVERWNPDNEFPEHIPQFMVDLFRRAKIKKKDLLDIETRRMVYELLKAQKLKQDAIANEGNQ